MNKPDSIRLGLARPWHYSMIFFYVSWKDFIIRCLDMFRYKSVFRVDRFFFISFFSLSPRTTKCFKNVFVSHEKVTWSISIVFGTIFRVFFVHKIDFFAQNDKFSPIFFSKKLAGVGSVRVVQAVYSKIKK